MKDKQQDFPAYITILKKNKHLYEEFEYHIFTEKLSEASRKYASLVSELDAAHQAEQRHGLRRRRKSISAPLLREKKTQQPQGLRKMHDIKLAFSEFYLSLILLQNYQTLNFTGFRKILKKHDKVSIHQSHYFT